MKNKLISELKLLIAQYQCIFNLIVDIEPLLTEQLIHYIYVVVGLHVYLNKDLEAIIELMGIDNMPLFIDETEKTVARIIITDIGPYIDEYYGVLIVYAYYDLMLKYVKSYLH